MSLSDAARANSASRPKVWRELRARATAIRNRPQWLLADYQGSRRRLCCVLIAELLRDQQTTAQGR